MKWLSLACTLVLAPAPRGAAARTTPVADTVALSFAWKPGMQASITANSKRTRVAGERTERAATWRYKMRVDPDTAGLRIHFEDPVFDLASDKAVSSSPAATQLAENAAGLLPDFVVAKDGGFKRVHDLAAYQARFRALMKSLLPPAPDSTPLQNAQAALTSEPFLNSKVAEHWNALVGTWLGAELELGESYGYSSKEPIALFPGQVIQMNYTFAVKRRLPCDDRVSAHRCVELEVRSVADPDDMKRLIETVFEKFVGKATVPAGAFQRLAVENVILLVTDPNGLIPHRMTSTKTMKGTMSVEGKDVAFEQVDVTQAEYVYP